MWYKQGKYLGDAKIEDIESGYTDTKKEEKNILIPSIFTLDDYGRQRAYELLQKARKLFKKGGKKDETDNIS